MIDFRIKGAGEKKSPNRVGLDIGSYAVKIVEVSKQQDKYALAALGLKEISGSSRQALPSLIRALADEAKISSKEANISVSGQAVIVRLVSMPKMDEDDLRSAIRFEAEKFIPFDIGNCIVDFQILTRDEREKKLNILLAAAKKECIHERIALVEEAGFSVRLVDVDAFALANSFTMNHPAQGADKTVALLNIGSAITNLTILRGSMFCLARDVNIGKDGYLDEMKMSFGYYENQSGAGIDEIFVSGGGSLSPGLDQAFQDSFGSKPTSWDPFSFFDMSAAKSDAAALNNLNKSSFAVAVGLALRQVK